MKKINDEKKQKKVTKNNSYGKKTIITLCVMSAITVLLFILHNYIYGEKSVFNKKILNHNALSTIYNKIPCLLASIQIFTVAWLISCGIRKLLKLTLAKSKKGVTVVKLLNSFIKYLIAIIAALFILKAWGVDTKAIIASAGILSLVIGLGAQSLISDVIAGFFIVFENEFQVGDIVIIDGWRGTIDEIGIRSTKIIDWQGNIKIINNSQIATIINQTKELSVTTCTIGISYGESLERVEKILTENLPKIKEAIPEIIHGPFYKGVDKLDASSVNLLFIATVKECDYYTVQRSLNRELKLLFDKNGINIPFPQVTLSYLDGANEQNNK